jgi:signal transduction histidine kinase
MVWIVNNAGRGVFQTQFILTVGWFDLGISGSIAMSVLLLGQAVVSYEVFTGKTLPRRGLAQYWRRAVILAAGFSVLASGSLTLGLRPIYTLLLSALVMLTFFALLGWRAFAERERLIKNLRPFAAGQKMIDNLLKEGSSVGHVRDDALYAPFQALCENVLETDRAGLFPYGPLALLAGGTSFYPPESVFSPPDLDMIAANLQETSEVGLALEPAEVGGMIFAVPLWREGGLTGVILLGQKLGGGPYTQEEIEIAQATGESLIDTRASAEMAHRLISLQRQHLVAGQVIDQRVRRKVHDEILPQVHTAMLEMVGGGEAHNENGRALELLEEVHIQLSNLLQSMPSPTAPLVEQAGLVGVLRRTVNDEMDGAFDEVVWRIDPQAEPLTGELPPLIAEVIYAAAREGLRNAARHGRGGHGKSRLCLEITMEIDGERRLRITLEDNGAGFEHRFAQDPITEPHIHEAVRGEISEDQCDNGRRVGEDTQVEGRSTQGGSGRGLSLHSTLMAVIGGSLTVSSRPGQYTRFVLELPRAAWGKWK